MQGAFDCVLIMILLCVEWSRWELNPLTHCFRHADLTMGRYPAAP